MISSSSFFCSLLICTQKVPFQTSTGDVVSVPQRKYCQSRETSLKIETGSVFLFFLCIFCFSRTCSLWDGWTLDALRYAASLSCDVFKCGMGSDPYSEYQVDKELEMALKGGRKFWEMNSGWAFLAPCSGKHCKKLNSLGKCSYQCLLFFSCHIKMKEKDPPKYFFFHEGPSVNNKKR